MSIDRERNREVDLMKDYKNLMPIGTIVKLKEDADFRRYMIIALIVKNEQGEQKDYVGVRYPAGLFSLDSCFFFDCEDIEEVVFKGLESEEHTQYLELLQEFMDHPDSFKPNKGML